jgi:hypothetical protein
MPDAEVRVRRARYAVLAAQHQGLEAGLAARPGDESVLQAPLDLGGGEAGDLTQLVLHGELLDLLDGVEALLGVQGLGQQGMQGRAQQQQRPHHDRRREQHHPGPQVEPGEAEAAQCYP